MTLRRLTVSLVAVMLVAAGCDGDDGSPDPDGAETSTSAPTSTVAPTTTDAAACEFAGSRERERVEPEGAPLVVTDVAVVVVEDGCVEAATVSLRSRDDGGSSLGYEVEPDEPPFLATNDQEVEVEGVAFVRITLLNGSTLDENFEQAYTGPDRIRADDADLITEVVKVSDFEGVSEWVVGLVAEHRFAVSVEPDRFAVAFGVV